jgi:hypothetical protein
MKRGDCLKAISLSPMILRHYKDPREAVTTIRPLGLETAPVCQCLPSTLCREVSGWRYSKAALTPWAQHAITAG